MLENCHRDSGVSIQIYLEGGGERLAKCPGEGPVRVLSHTGSDIAQENLCDFACKAVHFGAFWCCFWGKKILSSQFLLE